MRSGIILAGGNSSRFGEEKAFYWLRGKPLVMHVLERVHSSCGEAIVVVRGVDLEKYAGLPDCRVVADLEPGNGPLMGMYTGLLAARGGESLVVGVDMPLLNARLLDFLFGQLGGYDAAVPTLGAGRIEPLLSVYRTEAAAGACKSALSLGERRMVSALERLRVRYIPACELKGYDPGLESLVNINSKKDLDGIVREKGKD